MSAPTTRSATVLRSLLVLAAFAGGAPCAHAQTAGGTNFFDQLKKAGDDMSSMFGKDKSGNGSSGSRSSSSAATQVGSFAFVLTGCENDDNTGLTCHIRATNLSGDRLLQIGGGASSYIIDANGGQHQTLSIRLGTGQNATMTTSNVPVEGVIAFGIVDPSVKKIAELHLQVTGGQISWRNVSLRQSRGQDVAADNDNSSSGDRQDHRADGASSAPRAVDVATTAGPGAHGPHLTNDDVAKLLKAGLAEPTIVQMIDGSTPDFDTSANGLIALKQAGASDTVIQHIFTRQQQVGSARSN